MRWHVLLLVVVALACGCGGNPGVPAFRTTKPQPLTPVAAPRPASSVKVAMRSLPWWTLVGEREDFVLSFDEPEPAKPPTGRRIGAIRTRDIDLDNDVFEAVRCAWLAVPMGDPRPCSDSDRTAAMERSHDAIEEGRAELRAHAADAGASAAAEVRCFAERKPARGDDPHGPSHLWCEGVALADTPAGPAVIAEEVDPAVPIDHSPRLPPTRFVLLADAGVGMLGKTQIVSSTLALRYRPLEFGFYILDLGRDGTDRHLMGVGATLLGRFAINHSRADAIAGVSALAVAKNNSTNPDFDGLYHGFAGVAYQSSWRIAGAAQPFVQVRAGAAAGTAVKEKALPMVELHLGLSSPERR